MATHVSAHLDHFVCIATDMCCEQGPSVLVRCVAVSVRFVLSSACKWHWECSVI
jgi:hypothetical protein